VHAGLFTLALNLIALVQVGLVLERLVGSLTFAAVYLAAGVSAGLVALSTSPGTTVVGASGAVFGLYGLLVATWMWGTIQRAEARIRLRTIKWCGPVAAVFCGVHLAGGGSVAAAQCMGLVTGFVGGVLMVRSVWMSKPPVRRVATTVAAGAYLALVAAVPLRGVSDVRPALANVLAIETRTSATYDGALRQFRNGQIDKQQLARQIERRILPDLQIVRFELQALDRAPREHEPLVRAAEIYALRRAESWKIRSHALRSGDSGLLRNADAVERAALERLDVIR
jgi:rhomboid protease GluP